MAYQNNNFKKLSLILISIFIILLFGKVNFSYNFNKQLAPFSPLSSKYLLASSLKPHIDSLLDSTDENCKDVRFLFYWDGRAYINYPNKSIAQRVENYHDKYVVRSLAVKDFPGLDFTLSGLYGHSLLVITQNENCTFSFDYSGNSTPKKIFLNKGLNFIYFPYVIVDIPVGYNKGSYDVFLNLIEPSGDLNSFMSNHNIKLNNFFNYIDGDCKNYIYNMFIVSPLSESFDKIKPGATYVIQTNKSCYLWFKCTNEWPYYTLCLHDDCLNLNNNHNDDKYFMWDLISNHAYNTGNPGADHYDELEDAPTKFCMAFSCVDRNSRYLAHHDATYPSDEYNDKQNDFEKRCETVGGCRSSGNGYWCDKCYLDINKDGDSIYEECNNQKSNCRYYNSHAPPGVNGYYCGGTCYISKPSPSACTSEEECEYDSVGYVWCGGSCYSPGYVDCNSCSQSECSDASNCQLIPHSYDYKTCTPPCEGSCTDSCYLEDYYCDYLDVEPAVCPPVATHYGPECTPPPPPSGGSS